MGAPTVRPHSPPWARLSHLLPLQRVARLRDPAEATGSLWSAFGEAVGRISGAGKGSSAAGHMVARLARYSLVAARLGRAQGTSGEIRRRRWGAGQFAAGEG